MRQVEEEEKYGEAGRDEMRQVAMNACDESERKDRETNQLV